MQKENYINSADASSPVEILRISAENCDDNRLERRTHEQYSRERQTERERERRQTHAEGFVVTVSK